MSNRTVTEQNSNFDREVVFIRNFQINGSELKL